MFLVMLEDEELQVGDLGAGGEEMGFLEGYFDVFEGWEGCKLAETVVEGGRFEESRVWSWSLRDHCCLGPLVVLEVC